MDDEGSKVIPIRNRKKDQANEIGLINRIAVSVSVTERFAEWVSELPESIGSHKSEDFLANFKSLLTEKTVYLVPAFDTIDEAEEWFVPMKRMAFEDALESVCPNPQFWPQDRDEKLFDEYMHTEFHSLIWDLVADEPLE